MGRSIIIGLRDQHVRKVKQEPGAFVYIPYLSNGEVWEIWGTVKKVFHTNSS